MKKCTIALLTLALALSLAGCGGESAAGSAPAEEAEETVQTEDTGSEAAGSVKPFDRSGTIGETVLVDENEVRITATGLAYTDYGVTLVLAIENNSGKNLSFISGSIGYSRNSVNGYMVEEGYLNCDVSAGKKANDGITFDYDALMLYGITEIADLEVAFDITDEDYNHIYTGPIAIETSLAGSHDYGPLYYQTALNDKAMQKQYRYSLLSYSDEVLYDEAGVQVASSALVENRDGETTLMLEAVNTTDSAVYLGADNIGINGLTVYSGTWTGEVLNPGKRGILTVKLESVLEPEFWASYGLDEVGSASLTLTLKDDNGTELAKPAPLSVSVSGAEAKPDADGQEVYSRDGLRIVAKPLSEDPSEYSGSLHVLLLAENNSGGAVAIDDVYDSFSVNGYMADCTCYSVEVPDGGCGRLDLEIWESALEENGITGIADISEVEFGLNIEKDGAAFDKPTVKIDFS